MNRRGVYAEMAWAMIRTGLLGYGGGPSTIPLFRYEAVQRYRWLDDEEFAHVLAVANTLPGPIATKMAAYLGYRQAGPLGSLFAVLVHIGPTTLAMVILFGLLTFFQRSELIKGMIAAVNPVVGVMLGLMAYEFLQKTWRGLGRWVGTLFIVVAGILLVGYQVNAAIVVVAFLAYGLVHFRFLQFLSDRRSASRSSQRNEQNGEGKVQAAKASQSSE